MVSALVGLASAVACTTLCIMVSAFCLAKFNFVLRLPLCPRLGVTAVCAITKLATLVPNCANVTGQSAHAVAGNQVLLVRLLSMVCRRCILSPKVSGIFKMAIR